MDPAAPVAPPRRPVARWRRTGGAVLLATAGVPLTVAGYRLSQVPNTYGAALLTCAISAALDVVATLGVRLAWRAWLRVLALVVVAGVLALSVALALQLRLAVLPALAESAALRPLVARDSTALAWLAAALAHLLLTLFVVPGPAPKAPTSTDVTLPAPAPRG